MGAEDPLGLPEGRTIGEHPMHHDGELARKRGLALLLPARGAIRIAQPFTAVQPLTGLVRIMWAAW